MDAETHAPEDLVPVFVTVAVRTSAGAGICPKRVPPDEAGRLVSDRHAVYGSTLPKGFQDVGSNAANASNASDIANLMPQNG